MNETGKAVFLSYASQDAAAVLRLCEALRAAGVEVWFDQNELTGGDAWDAKIRGQIAACALFVPVISTATQARLEGYFRIEWKLAARRTHAMATARAFLLPVVIDDTRDTEAHVPDEFRDVQWTRLRQGDGGQALNEASVEKFCARVNKLLGGSEGSAVGASLDDARGAVVPDGRGRATPLQDRSRVGRALRARLGWGIGIAAVILLGVFGWSRLQQRPDALPPSDPAARRSAPPTSEKSAAPLTEARKLTLQARALIDDDFMAVRENFKLAEELCQRATTLDPSDGEAWATWARVSNGFISRHYDRSEPRRAAARSQAERAIHLAPESVEAGLALATNTALSPDRSDRVRRLQALLLRAPADKRIVWVLATTLGVGDPEKTKMLELLDEHRALFANDPRPLDQESEVIRNRGRFREANALLDRAQSMAPSEHAYLMQLYLLLTFGEDLAAARSYTEKIPARLLLEDEIASNAARVWINSGDGDKALAVLQRVPRDFFEDYFQYFPKGLLEGWALYVARRPTAAVAKWKAALDVVARRLAESPNQSSLVQMTALLQALTGQPELAEKNWLLAAELAGTRVTGMETIRPEFDLALGRNEEAIRGLIAYWEEVAGDRSAWRSLGWVNDLRFHPRYVPIRQDPRVQKIIAEGVARLKAGWASGASPSAVTAASSPPGAPDQKSVAVLAFKNLSGDPAREFFSDGLSEAVTDVLGRVPGLKVVGSASAFSFKGKAVSIPEIARQLGVTHLVEGTVLQEGQTVRITAKLIQADGFQIWVSDKLDRELKNIFALHDEVAGLIAKNLSLKLGASSAASKAAVNPQAFELYVQGRQAWNLRTSAGYDLAESLFTRALALEPNFARAHAALADVWVGRVNSNRRESETEAQPSLAEQARIRTKISQTLTLDPESAEAHAALGGFLFSILGRNSEAVESLRRAVALNPNFATAHQRLGLALRSLAQMDEALEHLKLATELDPLSPRIWEHYGLTVNFAGRPSEGIIAIDRALTLQPNFLSALRSKCRVLVELGRFPEADTLVRQLPNDGAENTDIRIHIFARAGQKAEAEALLTARPSPATRDIRSLLALGRTEAAMALMTSKSINITGASDCLWDPIFDPVRNDPRWMKLMADAGLTEAHARAQAWRAAHPSEKPAVKK